MRDADPDSLQEILAELQAIRADLAAITAQRPALAGLVDSERLLSCAEVDTLFRLREGTARQFAERGRVPSCVRRQRGRDCYYLNILDARHRWGVRAARVGSRA